VLIESKGIPFLLEMDMKPPGSLKNDADRQAAGKRKVEADRTNDRITCQGALAEVQQMIGLSCCATWTIVAPTSIVS
jgi:hypothetical protein